MTSPRLNVRRVVGFAAPPPLVAVSTLSPDRESGALSKFGTVMSENTLATLPDAASETATRSP